MKDNLDRKTVDGFGDQWQRFDQTALPPEDHQRVFDAYFAVFPWDKLPPNAVGFDVGAGSGRWAKLVAPRVGKLHCVEPSSAIEVCKRNLAGLANCEFHTASVDHMPMADGSMDFGYSLGVLHHVPNTQEALADCVKKLKLGAPFLVYIYYAFDSRPAWFRAVWKASDLLRRVVSRLPYALRYAASQFIAVTVYWPFSRIARLFEKRGTNVEHWPLSAYRNLSFYILRNDALDRFGTRLEQRFTRGEIKTMMEKAGLERITFSDAVPYWCAVGYRKQVGRG